MTLNSISDFKLLVFIIIQSTKEGVSVKNTGTKSIEVITVNFYGMELSFIMWYIHMNNEYATNIILLDVNK